MVILSQSKEDSTKPDQNNLVIPKNCQPSIQEFNWYLDKQPYNLDIFLIKYPILLFIFELDIWKKAVLKNLSRTDRVAY